MKDIKFWLIIGLVAIVIFLILTRPSNTDNKLQEQAYKTQIAILEAEKKTGEAQFKEIVEKSGTRIKKDSLAIKRYNVEINILKKKVAVSRARVDTIIRDNPELAVFVSHQDSIIVIQGQQIDTLKQAYASQIRVTKDLIQNHNAQERISQRIEAEKDNRIENLEKQNRRKNLGVKFWKVATVVSLVGGFFLGSQ